MVAEQTAKQLGIDKVYSELLPADKVAQLEKILKKRKVMQKWHLLAMG